MGAGLQPVADRDPLVKHKAFALPQAALGRHGFQVFEDAALEVVDLIESLRPQQRGRFFAANAAGTKHRHFRFGAARRVQRL